MSCTAHARASATCLGLLAHAKGVVDESRVEFEEVLVCEC